MARDIGASVKRENERLLRRCAYLEAQNLVATGSLATAVRWIDRLEQELLAMRAERDEARADAMAAILDHGLGNAPGVWERGA